MPTQTIGFHYNILIRTPQGTYGLLVIHWTGKSPGEMNCPVSFHSAQALLGSVIQIMRYWKRFIASKMSCCVALGVLRSLIHMMR